MILGLIISIGTVLTLASAGVRWLVKHYFAELKPNGGSSMRDSINRLEKRMDEADQLRRDTHAKIDNLYNLMIEYVANKDK